MGSSVGNLLNNLSIVLDDVKLLDSFSRIRQHYDEPKFWYYSAIISDKCLKHDGSRFQSSASGVSFFLQEEAMLKAVVEAVERYNNFAFFKSDVDFTGSYSDVAKMAINPKSLIYFSDKQLQSNQYKKFQIDSKSIFRWTEAKSINDKRKYFIPCQAIYLSYQRIKEEPVIYPSISTGAAGHTALGSAILGGIYEILERDAFMIYYLNRIKPNRYDLTSSKNLRVRAFLEIAQRYHLEIFSLETKTDLNIPTVTTIVIDRSGLGKAVSVGLKSHLDVENAIIGSISEAFHTRTWIREAYIQNPKNITRKQLLDDSSIKNRGLFWYLPESISKLDFFVKNLEIVKINPKNTKLGVDSQLQKLSQILNKKGYKIFYKDITSKYFRGMPLKVVKVIIPGMQPMYLNEKYPTWGGGRLFSSSKLNTYPHPFL